MSDKDRNKKICVLNTMMASQQEFSEACIYRPLVCETDTTHAVLSFNKDEERGIETAVSAATDTTGKSCAAFAKEQAQSDAIKAADRRAILKIPLYGVLFGFALYLTVGLIVLSLSDLKSLSIYQTTGTSSDSDRLLTQMSNMLLVACMMHPILVIEVITFVPILAWGMLLVTRTLLKIFKGTDHATLVILKGVDNDDWMFYTGAFVSGYSFGTRCWWSILECFLRFSYLSNDSVVLTDYASKALLLSFVQLCVMYGCLFFFPPHRQL
jgi:hypothetical protein